VKTTIKKTSTKKGALHPRNLHIGQYDFSALMIACPELTPYVIKNPKGELTINFSDPQSVLLLNKALLSCFYDIHFWQIPAGYLCPPIPGRVDYIHYIADLLSECFSGQAPTGKQIKGLDIGCGANCIYPLLASRSYGWSLVGTDIDEYAVKTAKLLVKANTNISKNITIRQQKNTNHILTGMLKKNERFAFSMCNPPFHASMTKATEGSLLKQAHLNKNKMRSAKQIKAPLNFSGLPHELSCEGGEIAFVKKMVSESLSVKNQVCWFTCLLSKNDNVGPIKKYLQQQNVEQIRIVDMSQGHKISRFIAWSYLDIEQQKTFFNRSLKM